MADDLPIIITVDPTQAGKGVDQIKTRLVDLEKAGTTVGATIARSVGGGLDGVAKQAQRARAPVSQLAADLERLRVGGSAGGVAAELNAVIGGLNRAAHEASEARGMFQGINQEAAGLGATLRGLLPVIGAVFAAKKIGEYSDAAVNLRNKLAVVTSSTEELTYIQGKLFAQAQANRTSFEGAAALYSRLAVNSAELGVSQKGLLSFTNSLSQAIKISGATAAESSTAMIQLSQGLASGALRGDELRSVLEQLPTVADVIAKGLGVTRGKLREMGMEGKITSKVIIDSFAAAEDELANKFGKTVPTIGDAITKLRNVAIQFAGSLQPVMAPLVDVFLKLVDVLGSVLGALGPVIDAMGKLASVAASALGAVADFATGTIEAVTGIVPAFSDAISSIDDYMVAGDEAVAAERERWAQVANSIKGVRDETNLVTDAMLDGGLATEKFANKVKEIPRTWAEINVDGPGIFDQFERGLVAIDAAKKSTEEFGKGLAIASATLFAGAIKKAVDEMAKFKGELKSVLAAADPQAAAVALLADQHETLAQGVRAGAISQEQANAAYEALASAAEGTINPLAKLERKIADETAEIQFGLTAKKADIILRKEIAALAATGKTLTDDEVASLRTQIDGLVAVEEQRDKATKGSKASSKASDTFRNSLKQLLGAIYPAKAATAELHNAEVLLEKAVARGLLTQDLATAALERKRQALADTIDPFGAVLRGLEEEIDLLTGVVVLTESQIRLKSILLELDEKGVDVAERQRDELAASLKFVELFREAEVRAEAAARRAAANPPFDPAAFSEEMALASVALKKFQADAELVAEQFSERTSVDGGIRAGVKELAKELADIGTLTEQAFSSAAHGLEDSLLAAFQGADAGWGALADKILADILRIAARAAILSAIGGIAGGGFSVAAGAEVLKGFATGGQFVVPGSGAPDSRVAAFRVSPRERVTIETQQQQRDNDRAAGGGRGGAVHVSNQLVLDPRALVQTVNTATGRRHMAEAMRLDPRAFAPMLRR